MSQHWATVQTRAQTLLYQVMLNNTFFNAAVYLSTMETRRYKLNNVFAVKKKEIHKNIKREYPTITSSDKKTKHFLCLYILYKNKQDVLQIF